MPRNDGLTPYRRHTATCPHRDKGKAYTSCRCPVWCDGTVDGRRVRESLNAKDWARGLRKLATLQAQAERGELEPKKRISDAVVAFFDSKSDLRPGTLRNVRRALAHFGAWCGRRGYSTLEAVPIDGVDAYRHERAIGASTWGKELEILRDFFRFSQDRGWCKVNPARISRKPKVRESEKEPYTPQDVAKILHGCELLPDAYSRARARAAVLLLRFTALRISDVATIEKRRVRDGMIHVRTTKKGKPVMLPVSPEVTAALEVLPEPRGLTPGAEGRYYFWSGNGGTRAAIRDLSRTLEAVYKKAGVPGAHNHRFRHTLASELLGIGATAEEVGSVLGNSPAIVLKHYAAFTIKRQERISNLLQTVLSGTSTVQTEKPSVSPSEQTGSDGGRHGIRTIKPS
jgi:site-specific recombinase XerD